MNILLIMSAADPVSDQLHAAGESDAHHPRKAMLVVPNFHGAVLALFKSLLSPDGSLIT
jgi:hypothetical protein